MKHILSILLLILPLMVSAQKSIKNPVYGCKSVYSQQIYLEKIETNKNATKLSFVYNHSYPNDAFQINSKSFIVAGGKELNLVSATGIDLDQWINGSEDNLQTRFVLTFPPIETNTQTIDFYESRCARCFKFYDIALNENAAAEIKAKNAMPDSVRNYAAKIIDNGQSLEPEEFSMDSATIKGKLYGYYSKDYDETDKVQIISCNPFSGEQETYLAEIKPDGCFEIKIPMFVKHQCVYVILQPLIFSTVVASVGKTVSVSFDLNEDVTKRKPDENHNLTPYYSGDNIDLNYALSGKILSILMNTTLYNDKAIRDILKFTNDEYKDYFLNYYHQFCQKIDTMSITKRAKELLKLIIEARTASMLTHISTNKQQCYQYINNEPMPEDKKPVLNADYWHFIQELNLDNINMLYADNFGFIYHNLGSEYKSKFGTQNLPREVINDIVAEAYEKVANSEKLSKKEMRTALSISKKLRKSDNSRTEAEKAFIAKYGSQVNDVFKDETSVKRAVEGEKFLLEVLGTGESYFRDFMKLQTYCAGLPNRELVPDNAIQDIENMRFKFYADYVKMRNADIAKQIAEAQQRGNLYNHVDGDRDADSLLVDILQEYKGKVVMIDFWATWCAPCRAAIKDMKSMEESFEGKDVAFLFITGETSPLNEWEAMKPTIKGHHYRLTNKQYNTICDKWGFSSIPSYVIIGKDGLEKDFHTGFKGTDYYKVKIEEELKK